jgi:hypothetical protein
MNVNEYDLLRYYDPTVLPQDRNTPFSDHHLVFQKDYMIHRLALGGLRNLPCAITRMDSVVHSVVHRLWNGFIKLFRSETTAELRHRGNIATSMHAIYQCGCHQPERRVLIDALSLETIEPNQFTGPPCTGLMADAGILSLIRDYYQRQEPDTATIRHQLQQRCQDGGCTCWTTLNGHRVRTYPGWHPLATI